MYCTGCGSKLELGIKFCTQCGKATELGNSNGNGKINVVRVKKFLGSLIPFEVYVDNMHLGTLSNGSTLSCDVTLAGHTIVFKSTEKDVIQDVILDENKKQVTIEIIPKMGLIAAKPCVNRIDYN